MVEGLNSMKFFRVEKVEKFIEINNRLRLRLRVYRYSTIEN